MIKVFTQNKKGDIVRVTKPAALRMILTRPFSVWSNGSPRIWRGTGKTKNDAQIIQAKYAGSVIVENTYAGGKP